MSRQYAIEQYEAEIRGTEELVETRNRIQRLVGNLDFKALISERYIINEAASFAATAGDPNLNTEQKADAMQMAMAPGHLKRWLSIQIRMGNKAEDDLPVLKRNLAILRTISDEQFDRQDYTFDTDEE